MCGIAGFQGPWNKVTLKAMTFALRHRGPDDLRVVFDASQWTGIGHTRLAIIDPTPAAAQPMETEDGRFVISFNGEIYNFKEIREELQSKGHRFRTQSDTEVLLNCFVAAGPGCLTKVRGIFSFCVWDRHSHTLFLARDPIGVKPLYYAVLPQGFVYASELKALIVCPSIPTELDMRTLASHIGFIWSSGEGTMLKAVRKLRPGHFMEVKAGKPKIFRYYDPPRSPCGGSATPTTTAGFLELLDAAVSEQTFADVKVGLLLSGGLDSSTIAASMRSTEPSRDIIAFSAVMPRGLHSTDNVGDDPSFSRKVASRLDLELVEIPTGDELLGHIGEMVWALDEPTADFAALQMLLLSPRSPRTRSTRLALRYRQ